MEKHTLHSLPPRALQIGLCPAAEASTAQRISVVERMTSSCHLREIVAEIKPLGAEMGMNTSAFAL